jgi:hypothetical protein
MYEDLGSFQKFIFTNINDMSQLGIHPSVPHIIEYISITVKPVDASDMAEYGTLQIKHTTDIESILVDFLTKLNLKRAKISSIIAAKCQYEGTVKYVKRNVIKNVAYNGKLQYELLKASTKGPQGSAIHFENMPQIKHTDNYSIRTYYIDYIGFKGFESRNGFNRYRFNFNMAKGILTSACLMSMKPGQTSMMNQTQLLHSYTGPAIVELYTTYKIEKYFINHEELDKDKWCNNKEVKLHKLKMF